MNAYNENLAKNKLVIEKVNMIRTGIKNISIDRIRLNKIFNARYKLK